MHLGVIRSTPTAYSKVTIQQNHLNRKNIIQKKKYKCKNNIILIYLTFIHCTCIFEKHKQSFLSENYEHTFPNKKHKQSKAHEKQKQSFLSENYEQTFPNKKHKQSFLSENCNRVRQAHARATVGR
jgi:hypothetical protein